MFPVCAYGGIGGYYGVCNFCVIFLLYCDDVWLRVVYEVFCSSILFLVPFRFI